MSYQIPIEQIQNLNDADIKKPPNKTKMLQRPVRIPSIKENLLKT